MTNKELDEHIAALELNLTDQDKEIETLEKQEERLIIEINLSKLVMMDKMKALHS